VVAMLLELLNAPAGAGGSVSAGGTESNMMAVKTARDWARVHRPDAQPPLYY
jgi:sphinganine-1-phosphate aldolase